VADKVVVQWQKEFSNQIKQLEAGTASWIWQNDLNVYN
jgi:hypothetical protein